VSTKEGKCRYVLLDTKTLYPGITLLDGKSGRVLKHITNPKGGGEFLGTDRIWRRRGNKIEIFNIPRLIEGGEMEDGR
jgi:hypothetical protein